MTVAGIDVSTKAVDVVLLDDEGPRASWHHFACADKRGAFYASQRAAHALPAPSSEFWDGVYLIGVEDPVGSHAHTQKALGLILGAVASRLPRGRTVILTRPYEWKRLTCGVANATKPTVRAWALGEGFGWGGMETQDACDAYCVARAVRELNDRGIAAA